MELISVIMPAHNASRFIRSAIESVLNQDYLDIELIIVDDCSSDDTAFICDYYVKSDHRVVLLKTESISGSRGISSALNTGLRHARGEYIARMDADDISEPCRFSKQRNYLNAHSSVGMCGTAIKVIDTEGETIRKPLVAVGSELNRRLANWCSPLAHPTWMFRREILGTVERYREVAPAEDYDFLLRVLNSGWEINNIPYVGLRYRVSASSTALRCALLQRKAFNFVHQLNQSYYNTPEVSRTLFCSKTSSSALMTYIHQLSERILLKAAIWKNKSLFVTFMLVVFASLISPYQIQFVFRAIVVKFLISTKST